ncbi:MAG: hypothetical protein Q9195_006876 [Heterodermia aff. obscurata]
MSVNDSSTFENERRSGSYREPDRAKVVRYDFITFLAWAQHLQVDFLPITWQSARKIVGFGGTSLINQALVDLHTSLVFKRISLKRKQSEEEEIIFRDLITEIRVLSDPIIREHSNILLLQGICWDIPHTLSNDGVSGAFCSDKVWPVLVFEKSQYGDLRHFATLAVGRELGMYERLRLCFDIGIAVTAMHGYKIIHGDIKPDNVLIFRDGSNTFRAKVTDFGYSTLFNHDDDLILLPRSRPWEAPEYDQYNPQGTTPPKAMKMDIFSFGLLCAWVLFEKYFSGIDSLPKEAQWAQSYMRFQGEERLRDIIDELKLQKELVRLSCDLLMAQRDLNLKQKEQLKLFFKMSLAHDAAGRENDMSLLLSHLDYLNWKV